MDELSDTDRVQFILFCGGIVSESECASIIVSKNSLRVKVAGSNERQSGQYSIRAIKKPLTNRYEK